MSQPPPIGTRVRLSLPATQHINVSKGSLATVVRHDTSGWLGVQVDGWRAGYKWALKGRIQEGCWWLAPHEYKIVVYDTPFNQSLYSYIERELRL